MSAITDLNDEFHAFAAKVKAAGHHGVDELVAAWHKLTGDAATLTTEAHADEMQIAQDVAPVIAEAKADAEHVATEAAGDVKDLTAPATPAAPQA